MNTLFSKLSVSLCFYRAPYLCRSMRSFATVRVSFFFFFRSVLGISRSFYFVNSSNLKRITVLSHDVLTTNDISESTSYKLLEVCGALDTK